MINQVSPPLACLLFCRGGTGAFGAIDERIVNSVLAPLAQLGFVVYGTQYSGGPHSQGHDEYGGSDIEDIFALYDEMKKREEKNVIIKMGLLGFSRGGMSGCLALRKGLPAKRAAFVSGLFDLVSFANERPDVVELWKSHNMFEISQESLKQRSAVYFSQDMPNIPYLFLHSKKDTRVSVAQSIKMGELLKSQSIVNLFEGDDHGLIDHARERNELLCEWFRMLQH